MRYTENQCVDCGFPCISSCRYRKVEICKCDVCRKDADVSVDGEDLCYEHFRAYLKDAFDELSLHDRAMILGVQYELL